MSHCVKHRMLLFFFQVSWLLFLLTMRVNFITNLSNSSKIVIVLNLDEFMVELKIFTRMSLLMQEDDISFSEVLKFYQCFTFFNV